MVDLVLESPLPERGNDREGLEFALQKIYMLPAFSTLMLYDEHDFQFENLYSSEHLLEEALSFVLRWEGGFSDHPDDPGGATNKGVTQAVYDKWRLKKNKEKQSVRQISDDEVESIYEHNYWLRASCDKLDLHVKLPLVHFDTAINMGPTRAAKILQEAVGAVTDGKIGKKTLEAVKTTGRYELLGSYCDIRERVYRSIVKTKPKLGVFLRGWLNRLNSLRSEVGLPTEESVITHERYMSEPMGHLVDLDMTEKLEGIE